jgi:hypothetical protein
MFSLYDKVLRRPVELAPNSGQTRAQLDCPLCAIRVIRCDAKNRVSFCISDEQPYSTRLWERAPSTTSIADIDRRLSHLSFWPCVELTRLSSDLIWNQPLKLALVNFKGECSILAAITAKGG